VNLALFAKMLSKRHIGHFLPKFHHLPVPKAVGNRDMHKCLLSDPYAFARIRDIKIDIN
jgi:hypothetical protein